MNKKFRVFPFNFVILMFFLYFLYFFWFFFWTYEVFHVLTPIQHIQTQILLARRKIYHVHYIYVFGFFKI
jgi:hypothetical protein